MAVRPRPPAELALLVLAPGCGGLGSAAPALRAGALPLDPAACSLVSPAESEAPAAPRPRGGLSLEPRAGSGPILGAQRLPAVWLFADEDGGEHGGGPELGADLELGSGYGFELGWRHEDVGIGLYVLTSRHVEASTREDVDTGGGFLEVRLFGEHAPPGLGGIELWGSVGLGAGFFSVEFGGLTPDSGGTALEGRLQGGILLGRHVALEVGAGAFSWGVPGETIGTGLLGSVGVTLAF